MFNPKWLRSSLIVSCLVVSFTVSALSHSQDYQKYLDPPSRINRKIISETNNNGREVNPRLAASRNNQGSLVTYSEAVASSNPAPERGEATENNQPDAAVVKEQPGYESFQAGHSASLIPDTPDAERRSFSLNSSSTIAELTGMKGVLYRYYPNYSHPSPEEVNTNLNDPVFYTGNDQVYFYTTLKPKIYIGTEKWEVSIELNDDRGTKKVWPTIYYDSATHTWWWANEKVIGAGPAYFTHWGTIRGTPPGKWTLIIKHDGVEEVRKEITAICGVDPYFITHRYAQGSYRDHYDNSCYFPDDPRRRYFDCDNPPTDEEDEEQEMRETTISQRGCALTACAMMLSYHGIVMNPSQLNDWFNANNGYAEGSAGSVDWEAVVRLASSRGLRSDPYSRDINEDTLKDILCYYGPTVVGVQRVDGSRNGHWVLVYGYKPAMDGERANWLIIDSADGQSKELFGTTFANLCDKRGFRLISTSDNPGGFWPITQIRIHSPAELMVVDSAGRRAGYDPVSGARYDEIPGASFYREEAVEDAETGIIMKSPESKTIEIPSEEAPDLRLIVTGTGTGTYQMEVSGVSKSAAKTTTRYTNIPVQPNEVHTYNIHFDGSVEKFEAEQLNLTGYTVEPNDSASEGYLIRLTTASVGSAEFTYSGDSGKKDLQIWYYDQNNYNSIYKLYINNVLINEWTADKDMGSSLLDITTRMNKIISDVQLNTGDQIKTEGTLDVGEFAALDLVEISDSIIATPAAAMPVFSLAGGTYDSPQSLIIYSHTGDAVIHYTLDGTEPNESAPVYSGPIAVTNSMTVKAYVSKSGMRDSAIVTAAYLITGSSSQVAAPAFTPKPGNYTSAQTVTIACATDGAVIRYTTDGSVPTAASTIYTGPITVSQTTTIKAYALKSGLPDSSITTTIYSIKVAAPRFTPLEGTYFSAQEVELACDTEGARIHYTTDGTTPTANSPVYNSPIIITQTTIIKAFATITGVDNSDIVSATYHIKVPTPLFSLNEGIYYEVKNIVISCATDNATIRYTTDGSTPNVSSPVYIGPITVDRTMTIKACALAPGLEDSDVATANYILKVQVPSFSPGTGTYDPGQTVTISCATSDVTIRYTTDGSIPNVSSPVYIGLITLNESVTIKALAMKDGWANSDAATAVYQINTGTNAVNLALGRPVAVSSVSNYVKMAVPELAVDGDITTFWYSGTSATQWIYVDLGSAQNINNVKLLWREWYPEQYQIQVSSDAVYWTTVYSKINEDGEWNDINFPAVNARYVRMYGTKANGSNYGYILEEFEVYSYTGVPAPTFTPGSGTYAASQNVTVSCGISDATIRYTTDGSLPNADSSVYSGPIKVDSDAVIRAYAVKDGLVDSFGAAASYSIIATPDNMINSDFESGPGVGWTEYPVSQRKLIDQTLPHSGLYSAHLGGYNYSHDYIEQQVTIPVDGALSFWWYMTSSLGNSDLSIWVFDCNDNWVDIFRIHRLFYPTNTWIKATYNLSTSLEGQTGKLRFIFESSMDNSLSGPFCWIDDIAIRPRVKTPTFNLEPGVFDSPQMVMVDCQTDGATIFYTTDGSDPDTTSKVYTGPIQINKTMTIKAFAVKDEFIESEIVTATYSLKAAQPTFNLESGNYDSAQNVIFSCATNGATIRFTLDGSIPTVSSPVYTGPIMLPCTAMIKAYAAKDGLEDSDVTSLLCIITSTPNLIVNPGFESGPGVGWNGTTSDGHQYIDGTQPQTGSYSMHLGGYDNAADYVEQSIVVPHSAILIYWRYITEGDYEIGREDYLRVSLYNSDGTLLQRLRNFGIWESSWSELDTWIFDVINLAPYVGQKVVLRFESITDDGWPSAFWIDNVSVTSLEPIQTAQPTFSPKGGIYNASQEIALSCATPEATIRYTVDGSNPTISSPVYSGPITVNYVTTIKAYAVKDGLVDSNTATAVYTITSSPNSIVNGDFEYGPGVGWMENTSDGNESIDQTRPQTGIYSLHLGDYNLADDYVEQQIVIPDNALLTYWWHMTSPEGSIIGYDFLYVSLYNTDGTLLATLKTYSNKLERDTWTPEEISLAAYAGQAVILRFACTTDSSLPTSFWIDNVSINSVTGPPAAVATPTFSPAGGTYTTAQNVTITCTTEGAMIRYTIDGSTPNSTSLVYSTPITITENTTIKAYATKTGMKDSEVATATYKINIPQVATPTFNPVGGTYVGAQNVMLSCVTEGVTIRYTIDGSIPNASSLIYTGPIMITKSTTIKAYATKTGMIDSPVATAIYEINVSKVATPIFSPAEGIYTSAQSIIITCATDGATIRYTTDGSIPNASSPIYNGPISITTNTTIKAYAYKTGMIDSEVVTATYQIDSSKTVATPTFLPDSETYYWPQIVKIFCPTKGAIIRYTTDGSVPDSTSRIYTHPIMVTKTTTIKAYAVKPGFIESNMATAVYEMKTATPFFSLKPGIYQKPQKVKIHCPTKGAVIRYTTDGSEPNHRSPVYFHPIILKDPTTIKAYAYKHGYSDSEMITATYMIDNRPKTATPIFIPGSGTRMSSQEIRITCKTKGAIIRYTTDGTEPDPSSPVFTGPLKINKTTTVKAYAAKEGHSDSGIATAYYGIMVAPPVFNPKAGKYHSTQKVKISCGTDGATIRYTVDGSIPNALSAIYTEPITISNKTMIKAYASKLGCMNSLIVTANYSVKDKKRSFFSRSGSHYLTYLTQRMVNFFRIKWATISFQMTKRFKHLI